MTMDEHKKFLADRLLSEERPITYRLLSRVLDVHVNTAKCMLYDFHRYQNSLKADSVHATYLIFGVKSSKSEHENGDVGMSSSMPEPDSNAETVATQTLALVGQENLENILRQYSEVTSIHVYSLAPHPQKDVALLADLSYSLSETRAQADSTPSSNKYGAIPNPLARRRDPSGRLATPATNTSKSTPIKQEKKPVKQEKAPEKPTSVASLKKESSAASSIDATPVSSASKASAPTLKRGGSGGIMQSFAKAAAKPPSKPKKPLKEEKDESAAALSDDGEADESDLTNIPKKATAEGEAARQSRKEREENLRRTLFDDDDMEEPEEKEDEPEDEEMEEAPEPEPEPETKSEEKAKEEKGPTEVISSSGDGRRRGKRRIMKKKRILDDQGYMVTIQEPGWESFSEDEAPQPPSKKASPASTPGSSGAKAKKPTGKPGQGNIMSFFSKK